MKFNLKNRPKIPAKFDTHEDLECWLTDIDDWFEGFEKELRELEKTLKGADPQVYAFIEIKEILGE